MIVPDRTWAECLLDAYGTCASTRPAAPGEPACRCLRGPWLGEACPHWRPLGVTAPEDLIARALKNREALGYGEKS